MTGGAFFPGRPLGVGPVWKATRVGFRTGAVFWVPLWAFGAAAFLAGEVGVALGGLLVSFILIPQVVPALWRVHLSNSGFSLEGGTLLIAPRPNGRNNEHRTIDLLRAEVNLRVGGSWFSSGRLISIHTEGRRRVVRIADGRALYGAYLTVWDFDAFLAAVEAARRMGPLR